MEISLEQDLKSLKCEGNVACLPKEPLNDYGKLKAMLTKANGKYKRNMFVFPYPAKAIIDRLLTGEVVDFKKEFQFFATGDEMADQMCEHIIGLQGTGFSMLEPGAGHGALIKAVLKIRPHMNITAIELSDLNYRILKENYPDIEAYNADFLTHDFKGKEFDLIVANPPFTKSQDIDHVKRMFELLKKGGRLITIMSTSWTFGSQKKQVAFGDWIEKIGGLVIENGHGRFKASGTMVNSVLVIIDK